MSKHRPPPKPVDHDDDWFTAIQPHLPTIGIIAAAVLLVFFVIGYWMETTGVTSGHWYELAEAQADFNDVRGEGLIALAQKPNVEGTVEGAWAHLLYADKKLAKATRDIYVDRKGAQEELQEAKKSYTTVEASPVAPTMLKVRAQYGIAEVAEATGDLDLAQKYYELVAKGTEEKVFAAKAKEALDRLKSEDYREFSAWFASQPNREPAKKNSFDLNPSPLGGFRPGGLMSGPDASKSAPPAPKTETSDNAPLPGFKFGQPAEDENAPGDTPSDDAPADDAAKEGESKDEESKDGESKVDESKGDEPKGDEPKENAINEPSGESPPGDAAGSEEKTESNGK